VEKSALQKFRDHTFRALGTPVTITVDAVTVVAIVGLIGVVESLKCEAKHSEY
jgi:hypothetical protein